MKISRPHVLMVLVIIEAAIIVWLVATRSQFVVQTTYTPVMDANPLKLALEYEASDRKFEELVEEHPGWISHRFDYGDHLDWPILADCALLRKTNYIRILLKNGADIAVAIESLEEVDADSEIVLLRQVQSELLKTESAEPDD